MKSELCLGPSLSDARWRASCDAAPADVVLEWVPPAARFDAHWPHEAALRVSVCTECATQLLVVDAGWCRKNLGASSTTRE